MSLTFTVRHTDVDLRYMAFKQFVEFNDELVTWDIGPAVGNGQAISSPTGAAASWTQLFGVTAGDVGVCNVDDGNGMVVYDKNLFISLYRSDTVSPKVIEYDPTSGLVTNHLVNPTAGGQNNYMGADSLVWNRNLWVVTDRTAMVSNRRVVYYYNGTVWTAITDYDGATYLDYNRPDVNSPDIEIFHRTTRLLVFNGELYLIASRYDAGWAWEVWKFDAENYDQFNLIYDSSVLADNFCLSAIVENTAEGKIYVVGNEIASNGNPTNIAKLYSSEDMKTWTEESLFPLFIDEFDVAGRDANWTDEPNSGTITEAAGILTLAVPALTDGNWWQPNIENAPFAKYTPGITELTVVTKLNSYTVNDETNAGLIIGTTTTIPDAAGGYCYVFARAKAGATDGLIVQDVGNPPALAVVTPLTTLPIWLRIRISGSGAGSVIKFDYSTDGITWTTLHVLNNATWTFVGLFAKNFGAFNAISAPFEFFRIYKSVGWPYGEKFFDGYIYLNCVDALRLNTWVRYWNELEDEFTLEQEITTHQLIRGGGMESFLDDLYIGKYREIYGAPGPSYKQTRTKAESLVGMEMTFVDKLGNETVRRYAPIDTRAPTRFYSGKIRSLSSVQRSVDDITGLFRIADMSIVLDNTDMEFSKIFAGTEYLKNQVAKLYHFWADEPERLRQHIISLIVEDHSMKGTAFKVKLKDITQKYFDIKVSTSICTADDYLDIHPDYEGVMMPEVLGLAEWSDGKDKGAVKSIYVDTSGTPWRYLASQGRLHSIDAVWADNEVRNLGMGVNTYQITWGPPTTIDFNSDQGDAIISFNAKGYSHGAWDSAAGHVQNPAYIMLYFLRFIMGIPFALLNVASFDALATIYDNKGVGTNGKLILQRRNDAIEILRQLLFTFGAKGFVAKDGKFKVERKDISNYATNTFIFDQIDAMDKAERKWGLTKAMNVSKDRFDYIPWLRLFKSAVEATRTTFPERIERDHRLPQEDLPI